MPHSAHCNLNESHSVFNSGRLHQWRKPGSGGGSEELTASWHSTKWAEREWRPLVSLCAPKTPHPTPRHTHTTHTLYCLARSPPLAAECHRIGYRTPCSLHSRVQKPPEELSRGRGYDGAPVTCGPRVLSWAGSHPGGHWARASGQQVDPWCRCCGRRHDARGHSSSAPGSWWSRATSACPLAARGRIFLWAECAVSFG